MKKIKLFAKIGGGGNLRLLPQAFWGYTLAEVIIVMLIIAVIVSVTIGITKAKFDKFSTLGLDYKPAMRSSENYISFLIQRPDVTDHNIPLSELKIFLNRTEAEKHIDLNSGDVIEFTGKVFSNALGDPWMDVDKFTVISTKPKTDNK